MELRSMGLISLARRPQEQDTAARRHDLIVYGRLLADAIGKRSNSPVPTPSEPQSKREGRKDARRVPRRRSHFSN
jgi:hypothetical protein